MKVFVTLPTFLELQPWEAGYARGFRHELSTDSDSRYQVVDRAEDADTIILMESNLHKRAECLPGLLKEPVLMEYCNQVCAINYEDSPAGFLRGLYSSLDGAKFNPTIHKSWPALYLPNEEVYKVNDQQIAQAKPRWLFSFIGSLSHPLRSKLVRRFARPNPKYKVCEVNRWFNHNAEEKTSYVNNTLSSQFVLCPRGHANYTHRISEAMAMGRVPVIIADGWIPFSISESDYFIRIPEADLGHLEQLLDAKKNEAATLGRRAREIWLKYFAPGVRSRTATDAAREIIERAPEPATLESYHRRWQSFGFKWPNQMTLGQRAWRRLNKQFKSK